MYLKKENWHYKKYCSSRCGNCRYFDDEKKVCQKKYFDYAFENYYTSCPFFVDERFSQVS